MNDQQFVTTYVRILNDTLNEAINKNLVMQAQLEIAKAQLSVMAELENKIKELSNVSSDNNALQNNINILKGQLDQANAQLLSKNSHSDTFKKELVDARNIIKQYADKVETLNAEIELLNQQIEELKSRKRKKDKATLNTVVGNNNSDLISISDTF